MGNVEVETLLRVVDVLEELGIPYVVGGSFASSLYGEPRSTNDVDLIVALEPRQVEKLVAALEADFYVDKSSVEDAAKTRGHFNVIHLNTIFKVDMFVAGNGDFSSRELERRQRRPLSADPAKQIYVTSPEDTVLAKLVWYHKGNEISDRQWRDILGVLKVQGGRLDQDYLRQVAQELRVADLLERALGEAGL